MMMPSFPAQVDDVAVVSALAYSWIRSDQPVKRPDGKQAWTCNTSRVASYSSSANRVLKSQTPGERLLTDPKVQAWLKFKALVVRWRVERGATSSITKMAMCDAYQRIIAMGPDVVPLIIAQMRTELPEPDQWFWALQVLTGADPVADEDRGDFVKMAQSWISWAENEGYAW